MLEAADQREWEWAARMAADTGVPQLGSYVRWRELAESRDRPPFVAYAAFLRADFGLAEPRHTPDARRGSHGCDGAV